MKADTAFSEGLASLRGLAAATVVIFHALLIFQVGSFDNPHRASLNLGFKWLTITHFLTALFNGRSAVVLFFVLSGTVLTLSLARAERLTWRVIGAFYVRRAFRLFPLLFAVTLVSALMHHVYFGEQWYALATSWMNSFYKSDPDLAEISLNALGWSNSLNSPAWTIRIEIVASILFPVFYFLSTRSNAVVAIGGLLISVLMFTPGLSVRQTETFLLSFYLGALIPRLGSSVARIYAGFNAPARIILVAGALFAMGWTERLNSPSTFHDPVSVLVVTLCAVLLVTIIYYGPQIGLLKWRPLLFLGEISYSLYLLHFLVLFMLAHAIAPDIEVSISPGEALTLNIGLALGTFAMTVPLAFLAYHSLERPCQQLGYRLSAMLAKPSQTREPTGFLEEVDSPTR